MNDIDIEDRPRSEEAKVSRKFAYAKGPTKPWEVEIDVYLNSVGPGPDDVEFDVETCLPTQQDPSDPKHPRIGFYNQGRNGFTIKFRLFDNTNGGAGSGYRFPKKDEDGAWSKVGTICPKTAIYEVFPKKSLDVKDSGLTLEVSNPNPDPAQGDFQYTLNVSTTGDPPYVHLDPGGNNMNGGGGGIS